MKKLIYVLTLAALLGGCAKTQTIRTSSDTLLIHTSAAPACGVSGAIEVAQKMAAIETLRAGYDRYIIFDGDAENNVTATTMPGSYHTNGMITGGYGYAQYSGSTYYQPGPTIYSGGNDAAFHIKMYKKGQKDYKKAVPAKDVLGPNWQKLVAEGVNSCS